jgi:iron complex transport system substrate-binding protein
VAYVSDTLVRSRAAEVGYDAQPDYETILRLQPDLLLTYTVSSAEPPAIQKLRSLGIRVLILYDHLEEHPLARAEYVRLLGALTGCRAAADSVFSAVRDRYLALAQPSDHPVRVLMNIPYGDRWYIPGADNFLSQLVRDAGGTVIGARPGPESSTVSVEEAYALSADADVWLHPGWCRTKDQLRSVHPLFSDFPVLDKPVYNNTLRQTPGGGNDFWESGAVRPDLILADLRAIFSGSPADSLHYYFELR